jgi:hypothetical protein
MSQVAEKSEQPAVPQEEFWRPPASVAGARAVRLEPAGRCRQCGAEYANAARFCHVCGAARASHPQPWRQALRQLWESMQVRKALGLSTGPAIALGIAGACVLLALLVGIAYPTTTLSDWQAVQMWRVEWLLAAGVALLAGILMRKS